MSEDPIGLWSEGTNFYVYVLNDPANWLDPLGLYWFRQSWQTSGVVGRRGTPVLPGGPVSGFVEQYVPAGYTFAQMHDMFVGIATEAGWPDWLVNIPTMPTFYQAALIAEALRTLGILDQPMPQEQADPCK